MRINKYLAACGIGSRRSVEGLVRSGKIFVDSKKITDLSFQVDPEKDQVEYKGQKLHIENKVYYLVNKPKDFVSTVKDINVRHKVTSLVPKDQRVFPVGRLDKDSSGLIILTNDGEFAKNYFRPKFEIEKEYIVEVKRPTENLTEMLDQAVRFFRCGIVLDGTRTKPAFIRVISQDLKKIS
ncbi:MAG: pseudouridine synthase [Candidatus Berkelbacteria bacterium]|nr:pseudouridine synthase [Candidatus Berkelbacteria bacterium]